MQTWNADRPLKFLCNILLLMAWETGYETDWTGPNECSVFLNQCLGMERYPKIDTSRNIGILAVEHVYKGLTKVVLFN